MTRAGWLILRGIEEFREHLGGELTITLLRDIGRGEEVHADGQRRDPARDDLAAPAGDRAVRLGGGRRLTSPTAATSIRARPGPRCAPTRALSSRRCAIALRPASRSASACGLSAQASQRAERAGERWRSSATSWPRNELYVFTINGFPYGTFHGTRVKEEVYLPDWRDEERLRYTDELADLLAKLLPDGVGGQHQHGAGRVQAGDAAARRRRRAHRRQHVAPCGAPGGARSSAPASTLRWRSSRSRIATWRRSTRAWAFSSAICSVRSAVRRLGELDRARSPGRGGGAARSSRAVPRPVPCGGGIRGSGRLLAAAGEGRHPRAQDADQRRPARARN